MTTQSSNTNELDQDELLHLALEALRRNDHGAALTHLKEGTQRFPDNANIAFLLGAEHAQIGMFDRAEAEFQRAVTIDPSLTVARFQLGLLQLTQARVDDARTTWGPLEELSANHPLRLFKQGLEALIEDRFVDAKSLLEQGIQANTVNPDLSRDMALVISQIPQDPPSAEISDAIEAKPVWFNAYQDTDKPQ